MRLSLRMKRALTGAAAGALAFSMMPAGVAFADVEEVCDGAQDSGFPDKGATHGSSIDCMTGYGVIDGRTDGTFGTFDNITRGATAKVVVNFALAAKDNDLTIPEQPDPFTDKGDVFDEEINQLFNLGIADGVTETTFEPASQITRGQFAKFLYETLDGPLGFEFDDEYEDAFPDSGDTFGHELNALAAEGIMYGYDDGTAGTWDQITRGAAVSLLTNAAGALSDAGLWDGSLPGDPDVDNPSLTQAPELLRVDKQGDLAIFTFDENVEGKALDMVALASGDDFFPGLRLYDQRGGVTFPSEASINDNVVTARFGADAVRTAVRAGVYTNTVQDVQGFAGVAGDFPLVATAVQVDPYFPNLVSVGNYRTGSVIGADVTVDFVVDFNSATLAADIADEDFDAADFLLIGQYGQEYNGLEILAQDVVGTQVTFVVKVAEDPSDVPESELRRGVIWDGTFNTVIVDHALISQAWDSDDEVNGTTVDPDLRRVERGTGNTLRFWFDQPVDPSTLDVSGYYVVAVEGGEHIPLRAADVGRSAQLPDAGRVVVASFDEDDLVGTPFEDDLAGFLNTATAAFVYDDAARATQVGQSQQGGFNMPAQVEIAAPVVEDPTPGVTDLPDLIDVVRTQNVVTGNWAIEFVFDQAPANDVDVEFAIYDAAGIQTRAEVTLGAGDNSVTFGPDAEGIGAATFSNEQIAAGIIASVADAANGLGLADPAGANIGVTEGSLPIQQ